MDTKVKELDRIGENIFMGTLGVFLDAKNKDKYENAYELCLLWEYLKSVNKQKPYLKVLQNRQSIVGALYFLSTAKYAPSNHLSKEKYEELQKTAKEYLEYDSDMFFKKIQSNFNESYEVDDNIVKTVTSELNITQKELADRIGMSPDSLNTAISSGKISKMTEAAVKLVAEVESLKKDLEKYENLRNAIKDAIS